MTIGAIIMAAGSSRRFSDDKRKSVLETGKTVLATCIETADACFDEVLVVLRFGDREYSNELTQAFDRPAITFFCAPDSAKGMAHSLANAIAGEPVDLTPPYDTNGAGSDPDIVANAEYKTVISYIDINQYLSDVPWTISWIGNASSDNLLEEGEKAEITVWLLQRDPDVTNATDNNGIQYYPDADVNGARGLLITDTLLTTNDQFTLEMKPESGAVLTIQRWAPARFDTVMDLK